MLLCQIRLILIILIWFGMREKVPFLKFLNNFPSMCRKISECLNLNRPGFGFYLLLYMMYFIASIMEPKHMCFDVLDFQGQSLFK